MDKIMERILAMLINLIVVAGLVGILLYFITAIVMILRG